jgi:hypothetical protein
LGSIKIIVSSGGGASLPILGSGIDNRLVFERGVSFEECYDFLVSENYTLSDFVVLPGEFSTRGGIIDVFPFSSYRPYRINFLDELPIIFRFNVDSQLTVERVSGFILSSVSKNKPQALKDVSLKEFLPVALDSCGGLIIGSPNKILKKIQLQTITHRQFYAVYKNNSSSIEAVSSLSSVGLADENNNISVPLWFVDKRPLQEKGGGRPAPLELGKIRRGDYLVHRDHGVGVCVGLVLKEGGASAQELLSIKYNDGGIISTDIGSLDLI